MFENLSILVNLQQINGLAGKFMGAILQKNYLTISDPDMVHQRIMWPEVIEDTRPDGWLFSISSPRPTICTSPSF